MAIKRAAKRCQQVLAAALVFGVNLCVTSGAWSSPVALHYELRSLAEPSRYEVSYTLENLGLQAGVSWFSVDFDAALYDLSTLLIKQSGAAPGWESAWLLPANGLPAQFDTYTLGSSLGVGDMLTDFKIEFTWLGGGMPGAQQFQVWDPLTFDLSFSGSTVGAQQAIPEPSAAALALLALIALAAARLQISRKTNQPA